MRAEPQVLVGFDLVVGAIPNMGWTKFFLKPSWTPLTEFQGSSDAAGKLGHRAIFNSHRFFGTWSASLYSLYIFAFKELFPIAIAAYLWGPQWVLKQVDFLSDESVEVALASGMSKNYNLIVL